MRWRELLAPALVAGVANIPNGQPTPEARFRFAVGSCVEEKQNVTTRAAWNAWRNPSSEVAVWRLETGCDGDNFLASSTTTLNVWKVDDRQVKCVATMANTRARKQSTSLPPLFSLGWSSIQQQQQQQGWSFVGGYDLYDRTAADCSRQGGV